MSSFVECRTVGMSSLMSPGDDNCARAQFCLTAVNVSIGDGLLHICVAIIDGDEMIHTLSLASLIDLVIPTEKLK